MTINPHFLYLNRLRSSGIVNMYGAAPILAEMYDISKQEARESLSAWMAWVTEDPERLKL